MNEFINALIDAIMPVAIEIIVSVVGILGALLLSKLRQIKALECMTDAPERLHDAVISTEYTNQQVIVDDLKAVVADRKLTPDDVAILNAHSFDNVKNTVGPGVIT